MILGELVNVVARQMREQAGSYVRDMRGPAFKLLTLYCIQVLTFTQSLKMAYTEIFRLLNR